MFQYLNEDKKLKLIQYNKNIQNKLGINVINYRIFSGKYITYETNRKLKEYNSFNDQIVFEGNCLNGKKNGKGKEYDESDDDNIIFEGNYLNGKKSGKGKEYDRYNNLIFNGEYSNGKRNGKGKEYYMNGVIKFEGEYLNGKQWNGTGYEGKKEILYKIKNGKGYKKEYSHDFIFRFHGQYLNGEKNGKAKEYEDKELIFDGTYLNGKRNGKGKEYYKRGKMKFEGEYLYGKRWSGKGYDVYNNIVYELKNGKGYIKEYMFDEFLLDEEKKMGKKEKEKNNFLVFEGEYLYGAVNGKGKEYDEEGNLIFEGEYINGKKMEKERNIMKAN